LTDYDGGATLEMYEFVPLGEDKYAFQTMYERAIVEYKNSKITSFIYSLNTRSIENAYTDSDSIYINSTDISEAWVSAAGADSYEQYVTYDGTTLKITASGFTGGRLTIEIEAQ
jgi:hypothetical protein